MLPKPDLTSLAELIGEGPQLQGVGPTPMRRLVLDAVHLAGDHLGNRTRTMMRSVQELARYMFQTEARHVIGLTSASSGAMTMATSVVHPGDVVLVIVMGYFSKRFAYLVKATDARVRMLVVPPGEYPTTAQVEVALREHRPSVVFMVQGETSAGTLNVELVPILAACREFGALTVVDAVCTASVIPLLMDEWGIDVCLTGGQKGLSAMAGTSLIAFSDEAWKRVESNPSQQMPDAELEDDSVSWAGRPWYFSALNAWEYWGKGGYHYTANVAGFAVLHEALRMIADEALEERWRRQALYSLAFQAGVEAMGLELFTPADRRLQAAVAVRAPNGIDPTAWKEAIEVEHHRTVAGPFGGLPIIRVGFMGEQCARQHVTESLFALGLTADRLGKAAGTMDGSEIHVAKGVKAAGDVLIAGNGLAPSVELMLEHARLARRAA